MTLAEARQALFREAMDRRDSGRALEAIELLEQLIVQTTSASERSSLRDNQVACFLMLGNTAKARLCHDLAIAESRLATEEVSTEIRLGLTDAILDYSEGSISTSLSKLEALLQKYSEDLTSSELQFFYEEIQQRRALALVALGNFGEALPVLEECLSTDFDLTLQDRVRLLFNLGFSQRKIGMLDSARKTLQEAMTMHPSNELLGQIQYQLAITSFELGAFDAAIRGFQTCEKLASSDPSLSKENILQWVDTARKAKG